MKVCPVCNESFAKELNFCDVDGARLTRQHDATGSSGEQSKVWQLLGVGLLLGALAISAASIFLPKNRVNPTIGVSGSAPVEAQASRTLTPETASTQPSTAEIAENSLTSADEIALAEIKKKERALAVASQSSGAPGPNPKAAALAVEASEEASSREEKQLPVQPQPANAEAVSTTKAMNEARESPPPPKPVPAVGETKDTRKQTADSKAQGKDPNNKKKTDEKEKKGGFLRVFKKIFGKD